MSLFGSKIPLQKNNQKKKNGKKNENEIGQALNFIMISINRLFIKQTQTQ